MAETKAAFRRRLGRLLHILRTATTSGTGTTTSFIAVSLTDFYPSDDTLNGAAVYDVTGAEWRTVTDWVGASGTGTVNRAYTASQASGRAIEVYEQFTPTDLDDAMQQAFAEVYPYIVGRLVDTSITVSASTYSYTIPSTIRDLERMRGGRVQWEVNTAVSTEPYGDIEHWEVRESGSTKTLQLFDISGKVGKTIRLIGWGTLTYPSTDATSIDLEDDTLQLLAYKCAEIAWRTGPSLTGRDAEFAQKMSAYYHALYEAQKDSWGVKMAPTPMESPDGTRLADAPLAYYHSDPS